MKFYLCGIGPDGVVNTLGSVDTQEEVDALEAAQDTSAWRTLYKVMAETPEEARSQSSKYEKADSVGLLPTPSELFPGSSSISGPAARPNRRPLTSSGGSYPENFNGGNSEDENNQG